MFVTLLDTLASLFDAILLAAQAWIIGGTVFAIVIAPPSAESVVRRRSMVWISGGAIAVFLSEFLAISSPLGDLIGPMGLGIGEVLGAEFITWHALGALAAAVVWLFARCPHVSRHPPALIPPLLVLLASGVMTSHAVSRLTGRVPLALSDFAHVAAVSIWVGGIPYLLMAIRGDDGVKEKARMVRRYSIMAASCVAVLVAAGTWLARVHVGSLAALVGSEYGALILVKITLLGCLLLLGAGNLRAGGRITREGKPMLRRIGGFAETEIGLGVVVLVAAASLGAQPPPVDTPGDLVTLGQMWARLAPHLPRLWDPPSVTPKIWSDVNHNVSGILVLAMGALALLHRAGWKAGRHWPLLMIGFAGITLRSDADSWPIGSCGFFGCGDGDPEVIQHRLLTLLPVAVGLMEWSIWTGRIQEPRMRHVFPLFCGTGAALLLTHSHQISDVRELYLVEFTHLPMAVFGALAGATRWLELRGDRRTRAWAGWLWPLCFMMVGLLLLDYQE